MLRFVMKKFDVNIDFIFKRLWTKLHRETPIDISCSGCWRVFCLGSDYDGDDVCGVSFKDPNLVKIDSVMDVVFSVTVFLVCLWAIYSVTSFEPMKKFASGWKNTILGFSITYGVLLLIEN